MAARWPLGNFGGKGNKNQMKVRLEKATVTEDGIKWVLMARAPNKDEALDTAEAMGGVVDGKHYRIR